MNDVKNGIARASLALIASLGVASVHADECDATALTCLASGPAVTAANASFLDLVRAGDEAPASYILPRRPMPQPAMYLPQAGAMPSAAMAPGGTIALDAVLGEPLANPTAPAWLALPKSLAAPDSSVAWIFALGFLGFVVTRRVRGANNSY